MEQNKTKQGKGTQRILTQAWRPEMKAEVYDGLVRAEDIVNARLGLMLVFVSILSGLAVEKEGANLTSCLLWFAAGVCMLLTPTIWRAQRRHNCLRVALELIARDHVTNLTTRELSSSGWGIGSTKNVVGYWLPSGITIFMVVAAFFASLNWPPFS